MKLSSALKRRFGRVTVVLTLVALAILGTAAFAYAGTSGAIPVERTQAPGYEKPLPVEPDGGIGGEVILPVEPDGGIGD